MKYFIITYGCQMNVSDSERIATILRSQGHNLVKAGSPAEALAKADLIVINTCSVRQSAMHRAYAKINQIKNLSRAKSRGKKIILAGCILETDKKKLKDKISEFWHPSNYFNCNLTCSSVRSPSSDQLVRRRTSGNCIPTALVPIMTGCDNFCSYCVVPYTRGREKSRPVGEIIKEIKSLVENGYKKIMLLGQNVNSYRSSGKNLSSEAFLSSKASAKDEAKEDEFMNFPQLLRLINDIPGNFTIKFMTSHPKDISDELIKTIAECEKISKEIHLPIQSGNNMILKKMNRKYTTGHYKKLIKKIRAKIPDAIISTDIIVGFPSETKKQFQNTAKLCKEIKFSIAYISKYSPRPGTAAYKMKDDISIQEKKKRWKILDELINKK